jgi:hypothetical protein
MRRRGAAIFPGVFVLLLLSLGLSLAWGHAPEEANAYARQSAFGWELGTQGSYVHQTAHLLFCGAVLYFIYEIRRERLQRFRGFRLLMWACGLLAFWNLDAFVGHWSEWSLTPAIVGEGFSQRLLMNSFNAWLYYVTQIDHYVLLVPAFYLFFRGLQAFTQEPPSVAR